MLRIVIVGGGIIGVAIARRLATAATDVEVVLCERDQLGGGTTARSVALFSWLTASPTRFDWSLRRDAWETYEPAIEEGQFTFERIGALLVAESDARRQSFETAARRYTDLAPERDIAVLDPADLDRYGVAATGTTGGLSAPDVGYLDPHEVVTHWADEARDAGASIRTGVGVTDVVHDGDRVTGVKTAEEGIEADVVVNAAGPWATRVNDMAGVSLPLRHTQGPILVLEAGEPIDLPFILFESGDYYRGEGTTKALAGRLRKDFDTADRLDPDGPMRVKEGFYREVAEQTATRVPRLDGATVVNDWLGLRTVTPDKRPIVGPTAVDGFVVACGMSGLGVTLAPAVADRLVMYHLSKEPIDHRLAADRFGDTG